MIYHIYCDESRQSKDRFMVIGGTIIPSGNVEQFNKTMQKYRREGENDRFIVHLDYRTTHYSLNTLKTVLNRGIKKKYSIDTSPFVSIEPRESKKSELIQINDIILGAIGFQKNGYDLLAGTRDSKKKLVEYIANQAGLPNLMQNSPWGKTRFTIWNFNLRE